MGIRADSTCFDDALTLIEVSIFEPQSVRESGSPRGKNVVGVELGSTQNNFSLFSLGVLCG